jgi:hypothetical protein
VQKMIALTAVLSVTCDRAEEYLVWCGMRSKRLEAVEAICYTTLRINTNRVTVYL